MSTFFNVAMVQITCDLTNADFGSRKAAQIAKIDRFFDRVLAVNPMVDLLVLPESLWLRPLSLDGSATPWASKSSASPNTQKGPA